MKMESENGESMPEGDAGRGKGEGGDIVFASAVFRLTEAEVRLHWSRPQHAGD